MITANRPRPGVDFAAQNRRPVGAIKYGVVVTECREREKLVWNIRVIPINRGLVPVYTDELTQWTSCTS